MSRTLNGIGHEIQEHQGVDAGWVAISLPYSTRAEALAVLAAMDGNGAMRVYEALA
jgi:hypothetical protein